MSRVTCHVSHVTCHMSRVTSHMSLFFSSFFSFFGQSGRAYWWRVCYQRGLPRLVYCGEASHWRVRYQRSLPSAASQWFCNGSVYTEPSEIHTNGSVMVLYGSVIAL